MLLVMVGVGEDAGVQGTNRGGWRIGDSPTCLVTNGIQKSGDGGVGRW